MTEELNKNNFDSLERLNPGNEFENWDFEAEESLNTILRALRRKRGFGLFFVQCNPVQGQRVITAIKEKLPQKKVIQIELNRESETLYGELLERHQTELFDIACVTGVEQAMYSYEDTKRLAGWTSDEIYNYSWKGLPPLLSHLNRQREAFEENLPIALIFLVPSFVIDYFVQRAPDFFDWRSGFFKLTDKLKDLNEPLQELSGKEYKDYLSLSNEERIEKILQIKDQILHLNPLDAEYKSSLLREQGRLFKSGGDYTRALDCFDRALIENPGNHRVWNSKGSLLDDLERYDEALASFDRAIELKPDYPSALHGRGLVLRSLERYEEAISNFDRALDLKPNYYQAWYGRGIALRRIKCYEKAIESFSSALKLQPDYYHAWNGQGIAFGQLERYEEALESFNHALQLKPDYYYAWHYRGITLRYLERYEEAIDSFDSALNIRIDYYHAWYHRGITLCDLERYEEAIESFSHALKVEPDDYYSWHFQGICLSSLERHNEAIENFDKALKLKYNDHDTLAFKGYSCYQIGRHKEAANCFVKLTELRPGDATAWNNKGFLLMARYSYKAYPVLGKPLLIRYTEHHEDTQHIYDVDEQLYHQALTTLLKAIHLDSEMTIAWANSSFPAYHLSQYRDALQYCENALELDPQNTEQMNDVIYSNKGFVLLKLQEYVNALNAFEKSITLNPQLDEVWIGQGTVLLQLKRYEEAIHSFTQALHLNHPLAQANLDAVRGFIC